MSLRPGRKIALPPDAHVWVNSGFIDARQQDGQAEEAECAQRPGRELTASSACCSAATPVNEVGAKGDWMEIEAPTNAYAFVAAQYLKQEAARFR